MKKVLSLALATVMVALTACAPPPPPAPPAPAAPAAAEKSADPTATAPAAPAASDKAIKVGIMTGTVSQNEEEFRAAENMKKKYPDIIETATYPDNFTQETETLISNTLALADNGARAIVFVQAVPGTAAAIDKVHETHPDVLFIVGTSAEDPAVIASKADIVMNADELGMGTEVILQAKKMGAKTFVHYSFPRHMSVEILSKRRDLFKQTCEANGIKFVDATAPDPTSEAGVSGAQQFILEDIPRKVAEFGKDTAFFSTNCSMQEPIIKMVLQEGALYPQQCCPSPYHAYPGALGISIPDDKKGDVKYALEQIKTKIDEGGGEGRFSTWPVPISMIFVEAGTEYSIKFLKGEIKERNDQPALEKIVNDIIGDSGKAKFSHYVTTDNKTLENFDFILSDFVNF